MATSPGMRCWSASRGLWNRLCGTMMWSAGLGERSLPSLCLRQHCRRPASGQSSSAAWSRAWSSPSQPAGRRSGLRWALVSPTARIFGRRRKKSSITPISLFTNRSWTAGTGRMPLPTRPTWISPPINRTTGCRPDLRTLSRGLLNPYPPSRTWGCSLKGSFSRPNPWSSKEKARHLTSWPWHLQNSPFFCWPVCPYGSALPVQCRE